jgi:uncharacterized protein (TIGR00251 family)
VGYPFLKVKVVPRSSQNSIVGFDGDTLRVKVKSAPVDGLANKDLITVLSKHFRVPKDCIEIISGQKSRLKTIRFHGMVKDNLLRLVDH